MESGAEADGYATVEQAAWVVSAGFPASWLVDGAEEGGFSADDLKPGG